MAKVVTTKGGKSWSIHFDYERIQKRCFTCQRLNHEQKICPLMVRKRQDEAMAHRQVVAKELEKKKSVLNESDPLYGVLREDQVGINSLIGRPKIAKEVMDEMRQYLLLASEEDKVIREDRVRKFVAEVEQDPMLQRMVLRLEAPLIISYDVNKGKGIVFNYEENVKRLRSSAGVPASEKLMASAIGAGMAMRLGPKPTALTESEDANFGFNARALSSGSTVFSTGFLEPCASSGTKKKVYQRRRPTKSKRKLRTIGETFIEGAASTSKEAGKLIVGGVKRKVEIEEGELLISARSKSLKVVPSEGLSNL